MAKTPTIDIEDLNWGELLDFIMGSSDVKKEEKKEDGIKYKIGDVIEFRGVKYRLDSIDISQLHPYTEYKKSNNTIEIRFTGVEVK